MKYTTIIVPKAQRDIDSIPPGRVKDKIIAAIKNMVNYPHIKHTRKLKASDNVWRTRVEDWRIFFTPASDMKLYILQVVQRKEAY